jgi:hypothetical protein
MRPSLLKHCWTDAGRREVNRTETLVGQRLATDDPGHRGDQAQERISQGRRGAGRWIALPKPCAKSFDDIA